MRPKKILGLLAIEPNGPPFIMLLMVDKQSHLKNSKTDKKRDGDKEWYITASEPDRPGGIPIYL